MKFREKDVMSGTNSRPVFFFFFPLFFFSFFPDFLPHFFLFLELVNMEVLTHVFFSPANIDGKWHMPYVLDNYDLLKLLYIFLITTFNNNVEVLIMLMTKCREVEK